jgi:ferredoxin-type protein NapH
LPRRFAFFAAPRCVNNVNVLTAQRSTRRSQRIRRATLLALLLAFPLAFNYWSPALPVTGLLERVVPFSLLFWAAWTAASLLAGRAGCGWFCPLAGLQETVHDAVPRRVRRVRALAPLRWVLFAGWIGAIGWAAWMGGGVDRVDLLYRTEHVVSWDGPQGAIVYVGMFGLVLLVAIPLGGRGFCSHLCWWAPLNLLGARAGAAVRLPQVLLRADVERCTGCRRCDATCPVGLTVSELVASGRAEADCVLCGRCEDACPAGAVRLGFGRRE